MKKILIRAGISPLENVNSRELLLRDFSGTNIGNYLYQFSIFRALSVEGTELYVDNYSSNIKNADFINNNYDEYIMPLADAFREDFIPYLQAYTKLIKKLTIPVVVVGVGLRADYDTTNEEKFVFDNTVKEFVKSVLEKSKIIGVRGQITSDYLSRLGFKEGQDHQVIGCPSMYAFGTYIKIREVDWNSKTNLALNLSEKSPNNCVTFINRVAEKFEKCDFIPQMHDEFLISYGGGPSIKATSNSYPTTIKHKMYKEDKVKYFPNLQPWLKFMKKVDFSVGTRLHGNIAATISGTPSILITTDARTREIAEYHCLPSIPYYKITDASDLYELIKEVDLYSAEKVHDKNFKIYLKFLEKNQVSNIFEKNPNEKDNPNFDSLFWEGNFEKNVPIISHITKNELEERLSVFSNSLLERLKRLGKIHKN